MKFKILKSKKFWGAVAGVATGAVYALNGDFAAAINSVVQSLL